MFDAARLAAMPRSTLKRPWFWPTLLLEVVLLITLIPIGLLGLIWVTWLSWQRAWLIRASGLFSLYLLAMYSAFLVGLALHQRAHIS